MAEGLMEWQWPDGGWNCDKNPSAHRSSFHETHAAAWGLHEYWRATRESAARDAAVRAGELFLEHRVFRRLADGAVIDRQFGTIDVAVVLPVAAISGRYVEHYGADAGRYAIKRARQADAPLAAA